MGVVVGASERKATGSRECTDCQKRTAGDKTGSSSSPMEVDDEDDKQDNSRGGFAAVPWVELLTVCVQQLLSYQQRREHLSRSNSPRPET